MAVEVSVSTETIPIAIVGGRDSDDRAAAFARLREALGVPLSLVPVTECDPAECVVVTHAAREVETMDLSGARAELARLLDGAIALGAQVGGAATFREFDAEGGTFAVVFANYRWQGSERHVRPVLSMHRAWRALLGEV